MEGFRHSMPISVRFRDVDAMGHVNNAVFFTYLETARVEYVRQVVHRSRPFKLAGVGLILAQISCQFKKPIFYGQTVEVGTRVLEMRNSSFVVEQCIETDSQVAALAEGVMVYYDYPAGKSVRIPDEVRLRVMSFEANGEVR